MADNVIVGATLSVNTEEAVKNYLALKGTVEDLKKEFKNAKAGSDEQIEALKKLNKAEADLAESQAKLNKGTEESAGHFGKLKEGISKIPGPLGSVAEQGNKVNSIFKLIASNPLLLIVTALVGVFTLLYKAFTATDEGAQKVQAVFDGIGAVIRELAQRVLSFGSAIVKFFTGDFSGAAEDASKAVSGFGDAMVDAYKRGAEASNLLDEVADKNRVLDLQYAALNAKFAKSKELLTDENATYRDKAKALKESGEALDKYYKDKSENDEKELTAIGKKYNIEDKLQELRKKGFAEGAEEFDNYLQTLAIGEEGLKQIEESIKKSIASEAEYSAQQRAQNKAEKVLRKQEEAERKEAERKAQEEAKKRREELVEFTNKLNKLQQENELATITDTYEKEKKQIEIRIQEEKKANALALQDKKLTAAQAAQIDAELEKSRNIQLDQLREKHNKEVAEKEAAFQKDLAGITGRIKLAAITDQRELERIQLKITYEQQLADAKKNYKDNADQLAKIQEALAEQLRADQKKLEDKYRKEDQKKEFDEKAAKLKQKFADQASDLDTKRQAVADEQALVDKAFADKLISEQDYNAKLQELSAERMQIDQIEADNKTRTYSLMSQVAGALADAIGRTTVIGKIAAIAQTTIDTYAAAWTIFRQAAQNPATIPFPAYPYIQAGLAVAAGIANVKKILSVQTPGGGGGGSAPSSSGVGTAAPAAPVTPAQVSTTFTGQQNATTGTAQDNRAYVVESDIRDSAERNARLNRAARLGGG